MLRFLRPCPLWVLLSLVLGWRAIPVGAEPLRPTMTDLPYFTPALAAGGQSLPAVEGVDIRPFGTRTTLAMLCNHPPVVRRDNGINTPAALRGKCIGFVPSTENRCLANAFFNFTWRTVHLSPLSSLSNNRKNLCCVGSSQAIWHSRLSSSA